MSRPLTIEDLFRIERPIKIALAPGGREGWLCTSKTDLEQNERKVHNYRIDVPTLAVTAVQLHESGASEIVYSGDGRRIFFAAGGQVWTALPDGSNVRQVTQGYGGAYGIVPVFDGSRAVFVRQVYENPKVQAEFEKSGKKPDFAQIYGLSHPKACARTSDTLMYRHWDAWTENRRNHLFIVDVNSGEMNDLTPRNRDVPPIALDSGRDCDISPDGRTLAFVMNPDTMTARSTNNSIYLMDIDGLTGRNMRRISDTDGCDTAPRFISNTEIGYCSMLTPGYEADAVRFKVYDCNTAKTALYLADFERSIERPFVMDDGRILFMAQDFSHQGLYVLNLADGAVQQLTQGRTYSSFAAAHNSQCVLVLVESLNAPSEAAVLSEFKPFEPRLEMGTEKVSDEKCVKITHFGDVLDGIEMHEGEFFAFPYKNFTMEGCILTPPGFDPSKKYPLILLIHGGPQGAFLDQFHYRWNCQMFAAQGAAVAFCNPHGSTGYGHDLTRAISRSWSDDCPAAILKFVDEVLARMPQIDPDRLSAAGASFGGFMINWLLGHTDRFKAFVSHDGIFNTEMSAYITDELWFCDYEFGGAPYLHPEDYQRHSPHSSVKNFKTPTLVVQGEQDFRCFINEGIGLFTALQYMGVESRLLYFPNEGHWVLDPADSAVWYDEAVGWLMKHIS